MIQAMINKPTYKKYMAYNIMQNKYELLIKQI